MDAIAVISAARQAQELMQDLQSWKVELEGHLHTEQGKAKYVHSAVWAIEAV